MLIIKIQARHRVIGLGLQRFFFDADGALLFIKRHHAIALGVGHMVGKHSCALLGLVGTVQLFDQVVTIKNIVAQHQSAGLVVDKIFADGEGLRQAVRAGLHRILNVHAPLRTVTQQLSETWRVVGRGNHQHVTNTTEHECGQRVIHHGLVVHRHELFADGLGDRVQTGA